MNQNIVKAIFCLIFHSRLQKQANFINQFGEGLIWNNVVIVAKQPGSFNLEQAVQGETLIKNEQDYHFRKSL